VGGWGGVSGRHILARPLIQPPGKFVCVFRSYVPHEAKFIGRKFPFPNVSPDHFAATVQAARGIPYGQQFVQWKFACEHSSPRNNFSKSTPTRG